MNDAAAASVAIASGTTSAARTIAPKRAVSPAPIACAPTMRSPLVKAKSPMPSTMKTPVAPVIPASCAVPSEPIAIVSTMPSS